MSQHIILYTNHISIISGLNSVRSKSIIWPNWPYSVITLTRIDHIFLQILNIFLATYSPTLEQQNGKAM